MACGWFRNAICIRQWVLDLRTRKKYQWSPLRTDTLWTTGLLFSLPSPSYTLQCLRSTFHIWPTIWTVSRGVPTYSGITRTGRSGPPSRGRGMPSNHVAPLPGFGSGCGAWFFLDADHLLGSWNNALEHQPKLVQYILITHNFFLQVFIFLLCIAGKKNHHPNLELVGWVYVHIHFYLLFALTHFVLGIWWVHQRGCSQISPPGQPFRDGVYVNFFVFEGPGPNWISPVSQA